MKRVSWPGVLVVAGSTIVSWLAGMPRIVPPQTSTRKAAAAPSRETVAVPAFGLRDWNQRSTRPVDRKRDIFAFGHRIEKPAPAAAPVPALFDGQVDGPRGPSVPITTLFKLIGFAEDEGPDGMARTAIISGQGQVYFVKEGDTLAVLYRVGKIGADAVELIDAFTGTPVALTLK